MSKEKKCPCCLRPFKPVPNIVDELNKSVEPKSWSHKRKPGEREPIVRYKAVGNLKGYVHE